MSLTWPYPGARWWKFDFHTHTPASKDTFAWQSAMGTPDQVTPEKWLLKYMAAEVDCVAVTDHNSGEWIDPLKSTYARMKADSGAGTGPPGFRELHLFPGVEISVQDGFHLLAIFDPTASAQTVSDLLAVVRYEGTRGDSDGVTREGAAKVVAEVRAAGGLAIPAHVDGAKGLLQLEEGTRKCQGDSKSVEQVLREPGILALEWVNDAGPKPALLDEIKLTFASVIGSDCHNFQQGSVPGSRYTWIKMAAPPCLEGLRLALLDGQGVSVRRGIPGDGFAPFGKPEHFIESIEVRDARFMGRTQPAILECNPYFNALIGGRGTGKSTVVHALRLAYRRAQELASDSEAGQTFLRFNNIPKHRQDSDGLLDETQICVRLSRDGTPYRLVWQRAQLAQAVEEWDPLTRSFKPSSSQAINGQRFPIRLFSQGQIAALAEDGQQSLLNVIDDAAGTSVPQITFDERRRAVLATNAQMRELDGKLRGGDALTLGLQDVQRKLARFEAADHAAVLKNYQRSSRQGRELERQFGHAADLSKRLQELARDLVAEDLPEALFDSTADDSAIQVVETLRTAVGQAQAEVEQSAAKLDEHRRVLSSVLDATRWSGAAAQAKSAYDKLSADLEQQGISDPSKYGRLVQEKQGLDIEVKRLDALQRQREALIERSLEQLDAVKAARQAISAHRIKFLQTTLASNPYVRMTLIAYSRNAIAIERSLRELLGIGDDNFKSDIFQESTEDTMSKGLVADLLRAAELGESAGKWDTPAFEESIQALKARLVGACRGENVFGARFNKFLKTEADKRPEYLDHIACWFPNDSLQVEYSRNGDGKGFQSIGQASAGQRAAAMLAFLLAHGNEPLVLDQPEDDLDNHLIYNLVVQQIRSNKLRRQLIIVTHNPNIVVNGDAELIYALGFENGQCRIKQAGSLQDRKMREEVCQVMEGGPEAFERRYQRLGREV